MILACHTLTQVVVATLGGLNVPVYARADLHLDLMGSCQLSVLARGGNPISIATGDYAGWLESAAAAPALVGAEYTNITALFGGDAAAAATMGAAVDAYYAAAAAAALPYGADPCGDAMGSSIDLAAFPFPPPPGAAAAPAAAGSRTQPPLRRQPAPPPVPPMLPTGLLGATMSVGTGDVGPAAAFDLVADGAHTVSPPWAPAGALAYPRAAQLILTPTSCMNFNASVYMDVDAFVAARADASLKFWSIFFSYTKTYSRVAAEFEALFQGGARAVAIMEAAVALYSVALDGVDDVAPGCSAALGALPGTPSPAYAQFFDAYDTHYVQAQDVGLYFNITVRRRFCVCVFCVFVCICVFVCVQ